MEMRWPDALSYLRAGQRARRVHLAELSLAMRAAQSDSKGFEAWHRDMLA